MLNHLDYEAMLPFQLFALVLLIVLPAAGAVTTLFYALLILLLAQFMILTRTFDSGRAGHRLAYWITNELYATLTIVGPFAILAYLMG